MTTNRPMKELLAGCDVERAELAPALRAVLDEGLVQIDGCLLLTSQSKLVSRRVRDQLPDKTGFECFVNHLHLEQDVKIAGRPLVEQAIVFGRELQAAARKLGIEEQLAYIVAGDSKEMSIRFHVLRPGEQWLSADIEQYEEAVGLQIL